MNAERTTHVQSLKERIRCSEYRVDPAAVADALLQRLALVDLTGVEDGGYSGTTGTSTATQPKCSKPARGRSLPS
jgi:Anti-sigma-28 factor, FlgM